MSNNRAFGKPGTEPKWNSSAKSGVGTALNRESEVWFTVSHGILNELFFPKVDTGCVRDMGLLVADGKDFFSEEKRHTDSQISYVEDGVPAFEIINTCQKGIYKIKKQIIADPKRNCVLQKISFDLTQNDDSGDYKIYALLAPHINNGGWGNTAWTRDGVLYAQKDDVTLVMLASLPFSATSVGYVGVSDAWQDISEHKKMTWQFDRAEDGNVAICGEINATQHTEFQIAIAFADSPDAALALAQQSLSENFDDLQKQYVAEWSAWHKAHPQPQLPKKALPKLWKTSLAAILSHQSTRYAGAFIASLSIPWGFSKNDEDYGGYHLVWPRDLVETAGSLLAANAHSEALDVLHFLQKTQLPDGHWLQNMWLDGTPYWGGVQLDETAFPILLLGMLIENKVLTKKDIAPYQDMVHRAANYLLQNGPASQQDRWEENAGYSPFTLAAEIASLLAAADILDAISTRKSSKTQYLREIADCWNDSIERWCYVSNTELSQEIGVNGYYVRIAPMNVNDTPTLDDDLIVVKNLASGSTTAAKNIVSPDALALVRFGLRAADDARMLDTVKVIDAKLKVTTPSGDSWYRYNNDGYGEHEDGSPFDGTGKGRLWPLMTGERAHYEIALGNFESAAKLLADLTAFANEGGMISEQIWDSPDLPDRELFFGRPSGSAMPLVWAHGEYVKLCRSLQDKAIFDMPAATKKRYLQEKTTALHALWRFDDAVASVPKGKIIRIESNEPFTLHWSANDWKTTQDSVCLPSDFQTYYFDIPTANMATTNTIIFTFRWQKNDRWEGKNFEIQIF